MKFAQIWTWRRVVEEYGKFKGRIYWYISEENHGTIAELFPYKTPAHTDANARLIAAAPAMYEALSPFAARHDRIICEEAGTRPLKVLVPFTWLEEARAALAAARGES